MSRESWEGCSEWYDQLVGEKGHYYHQQVILPRLLTLIHLKALPSPSLLDLGSGQGIISRQLPPSVNYLGVDLSPSLIASAKQQAKSSHQRFVVADFTKKLPFDEKFSHALFLLSLQNVEDQKSAIRNAAEALLPSGILVIVLNHPCFRIPRQSSWGVDQGKKMQYRRIDRYMTPMKIPIQVHPGKEKSYESLSFHYPLSSYATFLSEAKMTILEIEEWISDKKSEGKMAKMEDRAREEFPLFLAIKARKM